MEEKTSWIQRGLGQTVIYGASIGATKLVALLMLPVFTSFLPPEDYAKLDIIQTLANVLSVVIGFGLADTLFRFTGGTDTAEQQQKVASGIFGLALVGSVASLLIFQLLAPTIAENLPGDIDLIDVRLILASLSFTGCILVPMAWLRFKSQAMSYFGASAGRNALTREKCVNRSHSDPIFRYAGAHHGTRQHPA